MPADAATANPLTHRSEFASGLRPRRHRHLLRHVLNLEDFERMVEHRLPRAVFGYVSGGAEAGVTYQHNREVFAQWRFITRILRDVSRRSTATTLFGRTYAAPFAIAPMGASAVVGYDADNRMARAAMDANIPFILSANSITPLEELAQTNPHAWFAAYQKPAAENIQAMCERVAAAGYDVFMLTVDVPVGSNRENNIRTGYTMPLRPTPRLALDGLSHPRWLAGTGLRTVLKRGVPAISNIDPTQRPTIFSRTLGGVTGHAAFAWEQAELIRRHWKGRFVLKGILSKEDARIARESGVDGIVVSNHGGRQLDGSVSPMDVLSEIRAETGDMTVFADSGFRRGTDVLKALALGAHCVLIGRPFLFAAALAGEAGVEHAIKLLSREIDTDMALLGVSAVDQVDASVLR
ncbi:alpha-hydroxy acid oxidase [Lichenicoccus roseus]|uniref:Alpha-hydroxy-acid oxidizing protein n=1 Tax=Lichenicoccus roseus TaxID=2683649 RepID=A0A5R9J583_9PROT|nr:alpha-hydroxy acid oxidase [Lichenicoccus roseus]TLU71677.1 alpha-hydroxy-acid oxidizing protein [Lichenicoccus roseus]